VLALLIGGREGAPAETLSSGGMSGVPVMVAPEVLFHTLASDFFNEPDGTFYVQTGDIPAMWLRDSAAQTLPYIRLARVRPALGNWIRGVIAREMRDIEIDPYANAFRSDYGIWERKWEADSLAYPVVLAWAYNRTIGDRRLFTPSLHAALRTIVATYACEREHARCSTYHFRGAPVGPAPAVGLVWSAFRASDDPVRYPYNIPEQMFAVTALRDVSDLAIEGFGDQRLAVRASAMAGAVSGAIARYGVIRDFRCGTVYAYEVDGLGRSAIFDDANLPSLLAAPLAGFVSYDDPLYRRTRACVLSSRNPYFYRGRVAGGIGSPHTPRGYVWPLALIARALTSDDRTEILGQLRELAESAGLDGHVHESFDPSDPARFTRAEFGWANAMYAELLFRAAAGISAQPVVSDRNPIGMPLVPVSLAVVDPVTALSNRAALLAAFDRAVPLQTIGPDDMDAPLR
jgi:meiotically up-regulated gene 157 (Mug157) protein